MTNRQTLQRALRALLTAALPALAGCAAAQSDARRIASPTLESRRAERAREVSPEESVPGSEPGVALGEDGGRADAAPFDEAIAATPAWPTLGDDAPHSLELRDVSLAQAVHLIAEMAGVNVYLPSGLSRTVDASFPAIRLDAALRVLLERNELRLVEDPPGVFWVEPASAAAPDSGVFQLRAVRGEDVLENVRTLLGAGATVAHDPNQNFLVVRGTRADVAAVREYLARADRLKPQVLIEMEILEVVLDDRFEFGIQHVLSDPNFLGEFSAGLDQDFSTPSDAFSGVLSLKDFSLETTVQALSEYGAVEVISSPRVLAVTNTAATIEVVTEIPYVETSSTIEANGLDSGITSQETVAFKEAGIQLKVTPVVQDGDVVELSVDQDFSEVIDFFQGVPVIDSRHIVNRFLVGDRDAVVIGGLMQDRAVTRDRGVPVLMHLPLVGRLFRSDEDTTEKRELLVLITPHVLDPEAAARLSGTLRERYQERRRLGGVDPQGADGVQK